MRNLSLFSILFVFLVSASCDREERFEFPYVPINLTLGLFSDLGNLGPDQSLFLSGYGVKGLIIYRSVNEDYFVYDRACTYERDHSCAVNDYPSFSGVVECPCCKSSFLLMQEGDVLQGPAAHPLVRYSAFIDGGLLKIIN